MSDSHSQETRRDELLADRAVQRLTQQETEELQAYESVLDESYDRSAAAFHLAMHSVHSSEASDAPAELMQKIERDARRFFAVESEPGDRKPGANRVTATQKPASGVSLRAWSGWAVAALALIALFIVANPSEQQEGTSRAPSIAEQRASLMETATDIVQKEWTATDDPAAENASGDVVWSDTLQRGFMRFRGLAANDPSREQYQLWIFDAKRDDAHPVDGGVFDIPAGADEVLIPINAKLAVADAAMFAITVERPGGVVVSSRERLPLLAQL